VLGDLASSGAVQEQAVVGENGAIWHFPDPAPERSELRLIDCMIGILSFVERNLTAVLGGGDQVFCSR
jgi:hypothetical protein